MERKEAIEIVRKLYNESLFLKKDKEAMVTLIPELKESEDDRIKKVQKEPVSESNKELTETYLAVFDKKFPILPSLSGKQLADYKNFLNKCQQIFGLEEWGIRPIQSKLFEKLALLWAAWGAEHLQGVGRQDEKEQDIPVSEDLEEAVDNALNKVLNTHEIVNIRSCLEMFRFGVQWRKEQMLKGAFECEVKVDAGGYPYIPQIELYDYDKNIPLAKEGDKYKVVLIEEE